jgi:hypothetical protein
MTDMLDAVEGAPSGIQIMRKLLKIVEIVDRTCIVEYKPVASNVENAVLYFPLTSNLTRPAHKFDAPEPHTLF